MIGELLIEGDAMARVVGVHEIELNEGVDPEEFERTAREVAAATLLPGWQTRVLKGDRGLRTGRYVIVFEIESIEARGRFFPEEGEQSEETSAWLERHPEAAAAWSRFDAMWTENPATDYVEITG